jgi:hypothetical protein
MRRLDRSAEGSAVSIVAIIASAVVGVASPVAVAAVARRSRRELDASAARQRAALDAERERLQTTLQAERLRQRHETERRLLDRGTMLIAEFRAVAADLKLDPRGRPIATDRWRQIVHEIAAFRGRLLLWFDENTDIVEAFDGVMAFTAWSAAWVGELRAGEQKIKLTRVLRGGSAEADASFTDNTLEDVDVAHLRYVVAARGYLRS